MSGMPLPPGEPAPQADALRDEVAQLHEAVRSQRDIGVAIGLVSAWRTMLRVSQDSNTKVRVVARVLVATHDGTADAEDREVLQSIVHHLPASGWPEGRPPRG